MPRKCRYFRLALSALQRDHYHCTVHVVTVNSYVSDLRGEVVQDGDADGRIEHPRAERKPHAVASQHLRLLIATRPRRGRTRLIVTSLSQRDHTITLPQYCHNITWSQLRRTKIPACDPCIGTVRTSLAVASHLHLLSVTLSWRGRRTSYFSLLDSKENDNRS